MFWIDTGLKLPPSIQIKRVRSKTRSFAEEVIGFDFFFFGSVGAKCVSDIVGHTIEPNVEAIDQALDDYLAEHESDDTWYSFHEFIEDRDG